jgi:hypothetical protein
MPFKLTENDKFALIAVENAYTAFPAGFEDSLSDGTIVLTKVPFELGDTWEKWLGSIRSDKLKSSNLILIRSIQSRTAPILDDENKSMSNHVGQLYHLLQLGGVIECEGADSMTGALHGGEAQVREHGVAEQFIPSKGYTRSPVSFERLETAVNARKTLGSIYSSTEFYRFRRGLNILMDALKQKVGQDKLHQAVRSLEALILPDAGNTRKQFIHRCQTFATANDDAVKTLGEVFDMRSDSEHVHAWERSLQVHDKTKRYDIAWQRTRQIEALASAAYSRILLNTDILDHFKNETALEAFWKKIDDGERRKLWGHPLDLESIIFVGDYDGFNGRRQ